MNFETEARQSADMICNNAFKDACAKVAAAGTLGTLAAIKHDQEKPRYDLLPYDAIEQIVHVLTLGAKKYSDRNWEQGLKYSRCFAALQRHLVAWFQKREELDDETKTHHLANAACELLFLLSYEIRNTDINLDDRPVVNKPKEGNENG